MKDVNDVRRCARIGDVLRGAQPDHRSVLTRDFAPHAVVANRVTIDNHQLFTSVGSQEEKASAKDLETVHLCREGTHVVDAYFAVKLRDDDGSLLTVFLQYKHSQVDVKSDLKVSTMNESRRRLNEKLVESAWNGRQTVLVFLTNRRVVQDEDAIDDVLWISRDQLATHLHVFAERGLVPEEVVRSSP